MKNEYAIIYWGNDTQIYPTTEQDGSIKTFPSLKRADNYANKYFGENARVISLGGIEGDPYCDHAFIDADNEGGYGKEECTNCGLKQNKE